MTSRLRAFISGKCYVLLSVCVILFLFLFYPFVFLGESLPVLTIVQITDTQISLSAPSSSPPPFIYLHLGPYRRHWLDLKNSEEILKYTVKFINQIKPDVVVHTGDLTQNSSQEEMKKAAEILSSLKSPWYVLMGDHDYDENQGKYYYQFFKSRNNLAEINGWTLMTFSIYPSGEEWQFMKEGLKNENPTILFTHRLIYASPLTKGIAMLFRKVTLLSPQWKNFAYRIQNNPQIKIVISGHAHSNFLWRKKGVYYITTSSLTEVPHQFRVIKIYPESVATYLYTARTFQEVKEGKWRKGKIKILPLR
ncbi:MAG: hypothetical protein GXO71_01600 [Caldiserica bacterium]|nr:hypothetical protein [Caldisericota bacterium]